MRLLRLEAASGTPQPDLVLCDYYSELVPSYATLSHRWGHPDDEVLYHDLVGDKSKAKQKKAYRKIQALARQALQDGIAHIWVDTCCIDKSSSAELSEAINSIFKWYEESKICYVYLKDVPEKDGYASTDSLFRKSEWFNRGWTLQEMIAPADVRFFTASWEEIGRKCDMSGILNQITGVSEDVLLDPQNNLRNVCISQKMSWAAGRKTSRIEDRAYSLIGLFDISLPILYGEGLRSFQRLQEEIIRQSFDHTIFAWELRDSFYSGLLAPSPDVFAPCANVVPIPAREYNAVFGFDGSQSDYSMTNTGLFIQLPRRRLKSHLYLYVAFLACRHVGRQTPIFIYIKQYHSGLPNQFFRIRKSSRSMGDGIIFTTRLDKAIFIAQSKIRVVDPPQSWAKLIRPLVPDDVALQKFHSVNKSIVYRIHLFYQGKILNTYPMVDMIDFNEAALETEPNRVWTLSIHLRKDCVVYLILAVIDKELVSHIEVNEDAGSALEEEELVSSDILRDTFSSDEVPRSSVQARPLSYSGEEIKRESYFDNIVSISQETYTTQNPNRRVFSLWLKAGQRKDIRNIEKRCRLGPPPAWKRSLRGLLQNCRFSNEPPTDTKPTADSKDDVQLASQDSYASSVSYSSEHEMGEGLTSIIDYDLGVRDGNKTGMTLGQAVVGKVAFKESTNLLSAALRSTANDDSYRGISEDSASFNTAFVDGYGAAHSVACVQKRNGTGRSAHAYSRGYATGFARQYPAHHDSGYVMKHNTMIVPKSLSDRVGAYAEGYAAGYIAGYAAGDASTQASKTSFTNNATGPYAQFRRSATFAN